LKKRVSFEDEFIEELPEISVSSLKFDQPIKIIGVLKKKFVKKEFESGEVENFFSVLWDSETTSFIS
jgi:hypothetical protein